ncbi:MAG: cation transporter [Clostridia bacterium]|nr:cation transporter [Clostridia bacterium]
MISFFAKLLIKNCDDTANPTVRQQYGMLCGIMGIVLNLLLFAAKFLAGMLSASIAITADAFNNLSDAGSSLITLVGFRLAGQKPDPQHPFGHGRFEYVSGLLVSVLILIMGFELGKASLDKILNPQPVEFHWLTVAILGLSVIVKLYMGLYNRAVGKKIASPAMLATMTDSLSDAAATGAILIVTILSTVLSVNIDGYCGAAVALMILWAGLNSMKETISPLLGQPPEKEFVEAIEKLVLSNEKVSGIHDLIVNDYGPGRKIISLHAEVPADADIWEAHDTIDNIENEIFRTFGCIAVIHMDPIAPDDETTVALRKAISEEVKEIHPNLSVHDLRVVPGPTHTNVIFDAVLPFDSKLTEDEARTRISELVTKNHPNTYAVVTIDRSFT